MFRIKQVSLKLNNTMFIQQIKSKNIIVKALIFSSLKISF